MEVKPTCYLCKEPATLLCDGKTALGTCSRPMCSKHVARSFPYIACLKGKGGRRSQSGTLDYCAECNQKRNQADNQTTS